jgi:hypothetical protein
MKKENGMKTSGGTFAITGTAYWAKIQKPDPDTNKYTIDVTLDDDSKAMLKTLGISWRNKGDEKGDFFTPWKHAVDLDGNPKELTVLDADKKSFTAPVGNGSKVRIEFYPREWEYQKKKGVRACLTKVTVLEHKPYVPLEKEPIEAATFRQGNTRLKEVL